MRLIVRGSEIRVHFTLPMEVALLTQMGDKGVQWMPVVRRGETIPIGEIHTQTHQVRLFEGVTVEDRQVIVLAPLEESP